MVAVLRLDEGCVSLERGSVGVARCHAVVIWRRTKQLHRRPDRHLWRRMGRILRCRRGLALQTLTSAETRLSSAVKVSEAEDRLAAKKIVKRITTQAGEESAAGSLPRHEPVV